MRNRDSEMPDSKLSRRSFVCRSAFALGGMAAAGLLRVQDRLLAAVSRTTGDDEPSEAVKEVLRRRFGSRSIQKGHVRLDVPEDPPDGRTIPVSIQSDLPMEAGNYVKTIHLIVDKNPDIYLAGFQFTPAIGGVSLETRIKMRATSYVRAIAETSKGELWSATKKVFPGSNGCG
jgi:predicted secreted protein